MADIIESSMKEKSYFMKRMFLPVGQGAFYCEKFLSKGGKINIVYDCGTTSGMDFCFALLIMPSLMKWRNMVW